MVKASLLLSILYCISKVGLVRSWVLLLLSLPVICCFINILRYSSLPFITITIILVAFQLFFSSYLSSSVHLHLYLPGLQYCWSVRLSAFMLIMRVDAAHQHHDFYTIVLLYAHAAYKAKPLKKKTQRHKWEVVIE